MSIQQSGVGTTNDHDPQTRRRGAEDAVRSTIQRSAVSMDKMRGGGLHGMVDRAASSGRRDYAAPKLRSLGDIRDVTLGGSPGMGDTQNPMTEGNIPFYGDYIVMP